MPEIGQCFIHNKHAHYVLVEKLGLSQNQDNDWALPAILADATDLEAGLKGSKIRPCLTDKHARGYDNLTIGGNQRPRAHGNEILV